MTMWQGFAVEQIPGMSGAGKILPCGPFFYGADLSGISLTGPLGVNLANANLIGSDLTNSTLIQANFHEANLGGANLTGAKLARAQLPARLSSIVGFMDFRHGTSKWTTTPLQTASRKAVLILGRFSDKRKPELEAIRDWLRKKDFIRILFDFNNPSKDFSDTIRILGGLSRFIIADLTAPRSVPMELQELRGRLPVLHFDWNVLHIDLMPSCTMRLPEIEAVAAQVHEAWVRAKRAQGVTSRKSETGEELMVDYQDLSESAKELDRESVRAVYAAIQALMENEDRHQ